MSEKFQAKRPTHRLRVITKDGKAKSTVGAAWVREDGSFLVKLEPCTVLRWDDDVILSLFPEDAGEP